MWCSFHLLPWRRFFQRFVPKHTIFTRSRRKKSLTYTHVHDLVQIVGASQRGSTYSSILAVPGNNVPIFYHSFFPTHTRPIIPSVDGEKVHSCCLFESRDARIGLTKGHSKYRYCIDMGNGIKFEYSVVASSSLTR